MNDRPVDDTCGIFVSSNPSKRGNKGTKSEPLTSLQEALDMAQGRPVYVCAEAFTGSVTLASPSPLFGGLDCANGWAYVGAAKKTELTGDADRVAVTIGKDASGVEVTDFAIVAPSARAPGSSSIAVLVDGGRAKLTRCDLIAGDAATGDAGEHLADEANLNGEQGESGIGVCVSAANNPGPKGKTKACPNGGSSIGGNGGNGGEPSETMQLAAGSGQDGSPSDTAQESEGKGGIGEGMGTSPECKSGTDGASGVTGGSGNGAIGTGTLSAGGYGGVKGDDGTPGKPGQGGGGGGGAKGGIQIVCSIGQAGKDRVGASGGAGGTGGCGGAPGGGGNPGGSSIALVSLKATLTLTQVTLNAHKGGDGGTGGVGQGGGQRGPGGKAGDGAGSAKQSCHGGDGGLGGLGGPGGGGLGGHSLGLAYTGDAPAIDLGNITIGKPGQGGAGSQGNTAINGGKGADGITMQVLEFP